MHKERRVAALVPAYNEAAHIGKVITGMPGLVDYIIVVDDASTDGTAAEIARVADERVVAISHASNQGLGASLIDAHIKALEIGADIAVVMAGDGQMDAAYLPALLDPLVEEGYDFAKGNRFFSTRSWRGMPRYRVFGNVVLSFMTKLATGYWDIFDPQNGYTAITREASQAIDWRRISRDYSFENDVIAALGVDRRRIKDVDIPAVYGEEVSDIRLAQVVPSLLVTLGRAFWRRIWVQHVVRGFSLAALFLLSGSALLLFSLAMAVWIGVKSIGPAEASPATVMVAVIPALTGFQLLLAAIVLDVTLAPR